MNSWIPKSDKSLNKPIRTRDRKESLKRRNSWNEYLPISGKMILNVHLGVRFWCVAWLLLCRWCKRNKLYKWVCCARTSHHHLLSYNKFSQTRCPTQSITGYQHIFNCSFRWCAPFCSLFRPWMGLCQAFFNVFEKTQAQKNSTGQKTIFRPKLNELVAIVVTWISKLIIFSELLL